MATRFTTCWFENKSVFLAPFQAAPTWEWFLVSWWGRWWLLVVAGGRSGRRLFVTEILRSDSLLTQLVLKTATLASIVAVRAGTSRFSFLEGRVNIDGLVCTLYWRGPLLNGIVDELESRANPDPLLTLGTEPVVELVSWASGFTICQKTLMTVDHFFQVVMVTVIVHGCAEHLDRTVSDHLSGWGAKRSELEVDRELGFERFRIDLGRIDFIYSHERVQFDKRIEMFATVWTLEESLYFDELKGGTGQTDAISFELALEIDDIWNTESTSIDL